MPLITLILVIAIVGFILYLIETYIPMPAPFKLIIQVIIVIVLLLWALQLFGITGPVVGRLR